VLLRLGTMRAFVAPAIALVAALGPPRATAQSITIDGSLSVARTLAGPNYAIGADLGRQAGGNLFHSFGKFGLNTGESANFTGPATVANIIGRVTGGSASSVDGNIQSSIAGANLYLINPSGIVFGPNATVNVSGSFHAASADYVRMSDGARFQATNPGGSTFSAAAPAAFGFLGPTPAAIMVNGSTLGPVPGVLGLTGGPVTISGGMLSAPGGTIQVTSAAGPGEVPLDPAGSAPTVKTFGLVAIAGGAKLAASGGSVFLRAGMLTVDASEIDADNSGAGSGGQIVLHADTAIAIADAASIHASSLGPGSGGSVTVQAAAVQVTGSFIQAQARGAGNAGNIAIDAGTLRVVGSELSSSTFKAGNAGNVTIDTAGSLLVDGTAESLPTGIFSQALRGSSGVAGTIDIGAGSLTILNNAKISTGTFAAGHGGTINVSVAGALTIVGTAASGVDLSSETGILSRSEARGSGDAGDLTITSGSLVLSNNGVIASDALSPQGNAGDVSVNIAGALTIEGTSAQVLTGISSRTTAGTAGNAGQVSVIAGSASISGGGRIATVSEGSGSAGMIAVSAKGALLLSGSGGGIDSSATASGDAGPIAATASRITIAAGAGIRSTASGTGNAGMISVSARGPLAIDGAAAAGTEIDASAKGQGSGAGGSVAVVAGNLTMTSGARIGGTIAGSGPGGSVRVVARGALSLSDPGTEIVASASRTASGDAGSISVRAARIAVVAGAQISGATYGTGAGGSVSVRTPGDLVLDGGGAAGTRIDSSATGAHSAHGGSITVAAGELTLTGDARIASGTAGAGGGGNINITVGGGVDLSGPGPQINARARRGGQAGSIKLAAGSLRLQQGAGISTSAATDHGGDITLAIGDALLVRQSEITSSVRGAHGDGGNIAIDARSLVLDGSQITAKAVLGHGGNIAIHTGEYIASADSVVSASSELGISGTIEIEGPRVELNGSLVVLPSALESAAAIEREACAARGAQPRSSLSEGGRGGLPEDPDLAVPALYFAGREPRAPEPGAGPRDGTFPLRTTLDLRRRCG
jgi:filamentous hemagglutinin family protein